MTRGGQEVENKGGKGGVASAVVAARMWFGIVLTKVWGTGGAGEKGLGLRFAQSYV